MKSYTEVEFKIRLAIAF